MTTITFANAAFAVLTGTADALPIDYAPPTPQTEIASELLGRLGVTGLYHISDEILEGQGLAMGPTILALLHHLGHTANDKSQSLKAIERLHLHDPDNISIRLWLASSLEGSGEFDRIVKIYEPMLGELTRHPDSYAPFFRNLITAAVQLRRIDVIHQMAANKPIQVMHGEARIYNIYRRAEDLYKLGVEFEGLVSTNIPINEAVSLALLALDEYELIEKINSINCMVEAAPCTYKAISRHALVITALALKNGWGRAFRAGLKLAASLFRLQDATPARELWAELGLPQEGYEPFLILTAQTQTDEILGLDKALLAYSVAPDLDKAQGVWTAAYRASRYEQLALYAPVSGDACAIASRARVMMHAPPARGKEAPLWLLMMWLAGADRLLQVLAAYVGAATVVVTVGGDGAPVDLQRASSALLVDGVHLLSRPVVSWGGQKGAYHNFLEVMQVFLSRAPEDAWMATVCDRTYPIQNLQRLKQRIGDRPATPVKFGFGPPAWKYEWSEDVVEDLAERYHSALDEIFRTGRSEQFLTLATKSPLYGDGPNRINASIFNFSDAPISVNPASWHHYMISSLEADMRWMSFARLQAFVDVATETRSTYSRRLHPLTTRWVKDVLSKYDLRIGSTWAIMSRNYINQVLNYPELPEVFSAMDMGFAPEMNFFDTMGATLKLDSEFGHLFHVFSGEDCLDAELPAACASADRDDFAFIRKTNPVRGRDLVKFFADRIYEDDVGETLCWATRFQSCESVAGDPRPVLDSHLIERLLGCRIHIRDLFGETIARGRFVRNGQMVSLEGAELGTWTFQEAVLTVAYTDVKLGVKTYGKIGGGPKTLTLAPLGLVSANNRWSVFLDFDLEDVTSDPRVDTLAMTPNLMAIENQIWLGAGIADVALLAAFSDRQKSDLPTPTIEATGSIHEVRRFGEQTLALASIDGFPTLLSITGFAQASDGSVLEMKRAGEAELLTWKNACSAPFLQKKFGRAEMAGKWTLTTLDGCQTIECRDDNSIWHDDSLIAGRWIVREDGVQFFGLEGLIIGLADQFRLRAGVWRLSGWGWKNMKDSVTFSLTQQ